MYGRSSNIRTENTFVFTLNGLDAQGRRVHTGNETGWVYCICYRVEELLQDVRENNTDMIG